MKIKFTPQPYQNDTVAAVVGLFHGEGDLACKHIRRTDMLTDNVGNTLPVGPEQIQQDQFFNKSCRFIHFLNTPVN
jgi:hypothetical protein